jgi:hypothetical protein
VVRGYDDNAAEAREEKPYDTDDGEEESEAVQLIRDGSGTVRSSTVLLQLDKEKPRSSSYNYSRNSFR